MPWIGKTQFILLSMLITISQLYVLISLGRNPKGSSSEESGLTRIFRFWRRRLKTLTSFSGEFSDTVTTMGYLKGFLNMMFPE